MEKKIIIFLILFFNVIINSLAASEIIDLKTSNAQLSIDQKNLKITYNKGDIVVNTPVNRLWEVTVKKQSNRAEYSFDNSSNVSISKDNDIIRLVVTKFSKDELSIPVKAEFTISVKDDAFCFAGLIRTASDEWELTELNYPNISGIQFKNGVPGIYWTNGLGQYFDNPDTFDKRSLEYPSGWATMPWLSINSMGAGLYIGSHDPLQGSKIFNLEYDKTAKKFNTQISVSVNGTEYSIPDVMIKPYAGEWHTASKFYRNWYDKHFKIIVPPDWVKDNSGWLLAILKQQNMEVMWPYKQIDKLCDIAEQFNLGTIGLFGWAYGGHDHLYPFYSPDNSMGGRLELEKAIERAHKRGIRIIIYANGKIMDTSTDFYKYYGFETMLVQKNLQPQIQYYIKQNNSTPVIFAQACTGSDVWRRTMYDMGLQAATLGADGILYDQLGVMLANSCFSESHNHKPGDTDPKFRVQMVNEARKKAREINPEFIVMTEAANDFVTKAIDYTHGWGASCAPTPNGFPELLRYTFPEFIATQRNPNPMITRTDANYAAIYGLRHEVETRYPGDVAYLLNGTLPTKESYSNVVSPPDIKKMNIEPANKATHYVHSLVEFETANADFFRRGTFIDVEGIEVKGADILAKGFVNGNRLGVVVWNQNQTEKKDFSVSVPGYRFVKSSKPGDSNESGSLSQLEANSIGILIYEKM